MNGLHWNTVTPAMRSVWDEFSKHPIADEFYLAGRTALALQLGHRLSVDLDFFSPTQSDIPTLTQIIQQALKGFSPVLADRSWGNLVLLAGDIRVGFYGYGYELVRPLLKIETFSLASVEDIGLMKLDALLARASRKDFHDLYSICQRVSLRELLNLAPLKYPYVRDFEAQAARHMTYFDRAEQEAPVPLIEQADWEQVKAWFRAQAKELADSWLL